MLLVWKDEFAVDNGPIDQDHKMLVVRINEVLQRLNDNPCPDNVLKALYSLRMHAEFHFRREERIQAEHGYAGLEEHAAEHRAVLANFDRIFEEIEVLPPDAVIPDHKAKKAMLYRWVLHHLIDTDQDLKPLFAGRDDAGDAREPVAETAKAG
jgi:hemerythrin